MVTFGLGVKLKSTFTDSCAKNVKFSQSPIRPEQRRIGPNGASGANDEEQDGTLGAVLLYPDRPGCASPRSSGDASLLRPKDSSRERSPARPQATRYHRSERQIP